MISPFNTLAIAEYESSSQAQAAFKNLAYHKVNFITPIYLEFAPTGFVKEKEKKQKKDEKVEEKKKPNEEDT